MTNILDSITKTNSVSQDIDILTETELKTCTSLSDAIRKCHKKNKDYSNGTIARFLSKHRTKKVSSNHVYNVLHTELKRK